METYTMYDIELTNKQKGQHWFDPSSKRFFRSRYGQTVYHGPGGIYFVSSEQFIGSNGNAAPRLYTVRQFTPETGSVAHTKHTPGTWRTHKRTKDVGIFADTPTMSSVPIAEVCGVCVDDVDANARLIAAAPELLEALEAIIGWYVPAQDFGSIENLPLQNPRKVRAIQLARDAIAKAEEV